MSVRDQERKARESERRIERAMRKADREIRGSIEARQQEATRRAEEIVRKIEKGDVRPRALPGIREDSMESMESMRSMQSMESMESMQSAETVSGVTGEASPEGMQENMPLQGVMPYDPASAGEDLAQRVTEDAGAGGDMNLDAERRVDELGKRMFEN